MIGILFAIVCGLVFGSFITCASYRLPLELGIVRTPSFCPSCNTRLKIADLFPVFSWLFSGGKCRHCSAKISLRYPAIELTTAAIFAVLYLKYGFTLQWGIIALLTVCLLVMIVADLEHYIIPDEIHVALVPLGIAYRLTTGTFSPEILVGFCIMTALALLLHYGYSYLRGRAMLGYGDVKFFAIVGIWLDAGFIPSFLFVAGILGVVLGIIWQKIGRGEAFPFAPALAISLFLCVVFPSLNLL